MIYNYLLLSYSVFRLEEREQELRSELSAQNERYTKLLKIYVDYIETNNLSVSNNDIESGTVCIGCEKDTESNELVMKSTVVCIFSIYFYISCCEFSLL